MLEKLLSKLGASTKITVGVSISPSVGLEMIEVDRSTGTVSKYANRPLEYNHSSREIADYEQFRTALEELFEELNISTKSNVVLSLPNVHFGMITLPLLLNDEAITNAIISEVEQSYIFKRQEPVVSWEQIHANVDTENRTLAYTAIQQSTLDQLTEICNDIGCTIVGVENAYNSLLKALDYAGSAREQMKDKTTWNLMVIGQNSYSIISMQDKNIMEYYEEPLALKSFVDDEIYNAITISAQLTLSNLYANYLYVVSETDLVSAEVLSMKISVDSKVNFLECNKFSQTELLPANLEILPKNALQITPEAIGAAIFQFSDYPLKMNMVKDKESGSGTFEEETKCPTVNIGNLEIELTPSFVIKVSILIGAVIIIPLLIAILFLNQIVLPREQGKLDTINTKIEQLNAEIEKYNQANKSDAFDLKATTDKIISQNEIKLAYYGALGMSVTNKLWVTYYAMGDVGKIDIKGKANDVKSIYDFYKGIKQFVNNSDIRLYKLEISSGSLDDVVADISSPKTYEFEITNMTDAELNPQAAAAAAANQPATPQTQTPAPTNQPFQLGKPLFGPKDNATGDGAQPAGSTAPANPSPSPSPSPAPPTSGGAKLPGNLEKIEKF